MKLPEMEANAFHMCSSCSLGARHKGQSLFSDKLRKQAPGKDNATQLLDSVVLDVVAPALSTAVAPCAKATNGGAKPVVPERNVTLEYLRANEMKGTGHLRLRASRASC